MSFDPDALRALRHDVRAPLVLIDGFARLLAADQPVGDAERRDYAERIRAAAREVTAVVERTVG